MRLLVLSVSALCAACLGVTCASAQTGQWGEAEDQIPPYRTHIDRRHGNDHVYPDLGSVVRDVPRGAVAVNYAGFTFRFAGGVWYQRMGPAYIVVAPPIGLIVPQLPAFATTFDSAGKTYLYADDAFYRPRPDLGGYEVVNDPQDLAPERARASERSRAPIVSRSRLRVASAAPGLPQTAPRPAVQPTSTVAPEGPPPERESMAPPPTFPVAAATSVSTPPAPANPTGVPIHPLDGQPLQQQATDRYECYRFAVAQTGFDPLAAHSGLAPVAVAQGNSEYSQAQAACLEGRGYTVQ